VGGVETAVGKNQVRGKVADLHGTPLYGLGFVGTVPCACPVGAITGVCGAASCGGNYIIARSFPISWIECRR
jgi:hypothetical protein